MFVLRGILVFEKSGESTPSNNKCIPTQTGAGNVHTLRAVEDTTGNHLQRRKNFGFHLTRRTKQMKYNRSIFWVFQVLCPNYEYQERPCSFFSLTEIEKHIYEVTITESVIFIFRSNRFVITSQKCEASVFADEEIFFWFSLLFQTNVFHIFPVRRSIFLCKVAPALRISARKKEGVENPDQLKKVGAKSRRELNQPINFLQ